MKWARQAPRDHLRWRNANARHRDVLAAERKEHARIRSEKAFAGASAPSRQQPEPIRRTNAITALGWRYEARYS